MQIPVPPPPLNELLARLESKNFFGKIVQDLPYGVSQGRYLHWDSMRHRTPPNGLTHDQWWAATKIARLTVQRRLPLADEHGRFFNYCLPDDVMRNVDFVITNTGGRIGLNEEVANPTNRDQYLVDSLIEESVTSSQIEGASTSRRVAREMIRSGRPPRDRSETMILNNFRAMERVGELRHEPLTIDLICDLQRIVTEGTLDDPESAGRFQTPAEARIAVFDDQGELLHTPPPAETIPERMQALCDFANAKASTDGPYLPGVLRALTIHFMMGYEHPFEDGNGRTARILFYWSMLNQGFWITEFISVSRILKGAQAKYARSYLLTEVDDNDLTYFFDYHLGVIHTAIDHLNQYLTRKMAEVKELRTKLRNEADYLNSRQLALVQNSLKHPDVSYSVLSHSMSHRVSGETARQDLVALEQANLLERRRVGKRFVYAPVSNLADAIKDLSAAR
ncbi:Fic family protein [Winogradskya consettensis]|uniref:Fic family protein n=1 Tax=Winogradskya consettensis TaxID=113560 RepID=A0A919VQF7_9ACTN|nr:Fic family protein [Actinoplanes consettensis]GIM72506.1 Fic family protein [Actinoplanes consettensis]